ncbi:MAG: PKD-like domain-containing protein [Bacteroidia bacterium]|nr:PKD-like domain-containing protein [Bacteroidia bacterium]
MKNNYGYSIQNINKIIACIKQFFIAIVIIASISLNNSFGQVSIIAPSLTVTGCSFPTNYSNLGNIVIRETTIGSIGASGSVVTLTLSAPTGFEFSPGTGAVGATPGDITASSIIVVSNNLTVSLTGATASNFDTITISNLMVRGISGATGASNITRTGGTATIAGDPNGTAHASLTSVLNNVTGGYISTPQTICYNGDPAPFTETVASTGPGTLTYEWKHNTDGYSATLSTTPTYDIPPGLTSTTTYRRITTCTFGGVTCTANSTTDLTITVMPLVIGGTNLGPQTICSGSAPTGLLGGTATGGDGTYTYLWEQSTTSPTTGFTAATNTNTAADYYPNSLTDTTWYRRKVTSAGCSSNDTAAIEMTVNPIPLLTSVLFDTACSGTPFNYNPTSQVIGASFAWSRTVETGISNAAASGANSPNETLINTTASPAFVYYLYTLSANGCTNATPASLAVTVNNGPELSSDTTLLPICSNTLLGYVPTSSTTGASFSWTRAVVVGISNPASSGNDSLSETLINTTVSPIVVTYIYTTTSNGCSSNQNVTVTVNPKPSLISSLSETICSDVLFNYTPTSLTTGATFAWTRASVPGITNPVGSGTDDPNEILYDTTTSPVNVNYIYTASANGCDSVETLIVTVNPAPNITNVTEDTICSGTNPNVPLTANLPSTFAWTIGENPGGITGGSDSSGATLNQILTNPSNSTAFSLQYQVTATSTSGTCSGNSFSIYITVNPSPLASAGGNSTICSDSSVIIGGSPTATAGTGPYTYAWTPVSGIDNAALSNPTANPSANTTYSVTVTDSLGCAALVSTMLVTVNPAPNVSAGADTTICIGQTATLLASGGASYIWSTGSSANAITVNPSVNTTYNVMGTMNGCSHSDTVLVTVNTIPVVNGGTDTIICAGQSATLSAIGGTTYLWSTGATANPIIETPTATATYYVTGTTNGCSQSDTVRVTVDSLPIINAGADVSICTGQSTTLMASGGASYVWSTGSSANSISVAPTATSTYGVTGTLNGCSNTDSVLVTVNSLPIVTISPSAPICQGQSETLTASGGVIFTWSTGASTNSIIDTPVTTTTYTVTVTDGNNCSNMAAATITVNPTPLANAGLDHTICIGDTATLAGSGGMTYLWTDGGNSFNTPTILVNPITSTQYNLTVTDNLGCTASDTALVSVTPSKDIFGHASYSGGPVTNGMAVLYKYEQSQTRFDSVQYVPLSPSTGDYFFTNVNYGQYLVKVFADSTSYPTLINTYYGDEFLWDGDSVRVINHSCNVNTTLDSVSMVELTGTGGGIGLIIGKIIEGASFGRVDGDPIPGVDVKLGKNPGGSVVATTNTDSSGHFTFSGVADGNYTIYVDIPGLGRDSSYTFTVDSTNNQFLNQNYIADSNSVFMNPTSTVGIINHANAVENKFSVYPNPVKGNTTIEYSIPQMMDSKTTLEVTTVLGVKINTLVNAIQLAGTYKYNFNPQNYHLNSGLYFITLTINGKANTKRIVVIE